MLLKTFHHFITSTHDILTLPLQLWSFPAVRGWIHQQACPPPPPPSSTRPPRMTLTQSLPASPPKERILRSGSWNSFPFIVSVIRCLYFRRDLLQIALDTDLHNCLFWAQKVDSMHQDFLFCACGSTNPYPFPKARWGDLKAQCFTAASLCCVVKMTFSQHRSLQNECRIRNREFGFNLSFQ